MLIRMTVGEGQSSGRVTQQHKQLVFNWVAFPPPAPIPNKPEPPTLPAPTPELPKPPASGRLGTHNAPTLRPLKRMRVLLCNRVEKIIRERNLPYVRVDEAKKALFASSKLSAFHLVVYQKEGPNWLVWAASMRPGVKKDMEDWEKVFGEGFKAVVARERANGSIAFTSLDGQKVQLK